MQRQWRLDVDQCKRHPANVDKLFADPLAFVGDTIQVEGVCSSLGEGDDYSYAYLQGDSADFHLRMQATDRIDGGFSPDCVGQRMLARGILREDRVGKAIIDSLERNYMLRQERAAAMGINPDDSLLIDGKEHSKAYAKAHGFDTVATPAERLAEMRHAIDKRLSSEGKDYISYFYLETIRYKVRE